MIKNVLINEAAYTSTPIINNKTRKEKYDILEFTAILQEADVVNRNKRIYPKSVISQGLDTPYVQERLKTRSLYVEMGHPMDTSIQRQMTIDVSNACALITEMWWEGNLLYGKLETLNTVKGRDFKGIIEGNRSIIGLSLRAHGKTNRDYSTGAEIVMSPIQICTWDYVVNPSHDVAWFQSISEESMAALMPGTFSLNEAVSLFENGQSIEINPEEPTVRTLDYTKNYNTRQYKDISDVYIYSDKDEIVEVSDDKTILTLNDGEVNKLVLAEDYIRKDIRHKISNILKDGE